jgi:hypothetical protein
MRIEGIIINSLPALCYNKPAYESQTLEGTYTDGINDGISGFLKLNFSIKITEL